MRGAPNPHTLQMALSVQTDAIRTTLALFCRIRVRQEESADGLSTMKVWQRHQIGAEGTTATRGPVTLFRRQDFDQGVVSDNLK